MLELFVEGGSLFMGTLTIIFLLMIVQAVRTWMKSAEMPVKTARRNASYVRAMGVLAFVVGVFGQLIGLYQAFEAIQASGDVPPSLLAGGLKVSMITTMYGTFIMIVSLLIWLVLDTAVGKRTET